MSKNFSEMFLNFKKLLDKFGLWGWVKWLSIIYIIGWGFSLFFFFVYQARVETDIILLLLTALFTFVIGYFTFSFVILFFFGIPYFLGRKYGETENFWFAVIGGVWSLIFSGLLFGLLFFFWGKEKTEKKLSKVKGGIKNSKFGKNGKLIKKKGQQFSCDYCGKTVKDKVWELKNGSYACEECYKGKK